LGNQKFCSECGYKFEKEYKFCPECGTKVSGKHSEKNKRNAGSPAKQDSVSGSKNLSPKAISGIIIGGIVVIALIILTSGVMDSPKISVPVNQTQVQNDVSSGVNLNNMQEINALEEKIKNNPNDYKSLLELAHLKNENADARVDMGVCYFNLKDYTNAIREMETALKYVPNHQIAHLNLGIVNLAAGNIAKSKEWLQKAYDINPTNEVGQKAENLLKNH
jgi:hypothetical protein